MVNIIHFEFLMPVSKPDHINNRLSQTHLGNLTVRGRADITDVTQPNINIDNIKWQNTDLFPLFDNMDNADELMVSFYMAAKAHIIDTHKLVAVEPIENLGQECF